MIRNNLSWINLNAGSSGGSGGGGVSDYNDLANRPIISMTGTSQNPLKLWNLSTGLYLLNGYVYYNTTNTRESVNLFVSITAQIQNGKYVLSAFVPSWEGHYEYIKANSTSTDYTDTQILKMLTEDDVLTLTNEVEYTPTTDYHPSTKKYVDEAMQSVMEEFAKMGVNEQDIKTLIAENRRRDIAIQALLNETADKNVTIEEDTHTISLDYSMEDGMATVNSIEGSTLVNVSKTVDEVYVTKSQDRVEQTKVANTIGEQNGKLCPIIEGDTLVNVCDQKDPIAITKSYTVENSGNHIPLQGEYDGKCRPVIQGNTMVNLFNASDAIIGGSLIDNVFTAISDNAQYSCNLHTTNVNLFKPSTTYTIIVDVLKCTLASDSSYILLSHSGTTDSQDIFSRQGNSLKLEKIIGRQIYVRTTVDDFTGIKYATRSFLINTSLTEGQEISYRVQIFEGDLTQTPELIPTEYVEGLKNSFEDNLVTQAMVDSGEESAENLGKYKVEYKVTGKNKFDGEVSSKYNEDILFTKDSEGILSAIDKTRDGRLWGYDYCQYYLKLNKGDYTITCEVISPSTSEYTQIRLYNRSNKSITYISKEEMQTVGTYYKQFTLGEDTEFGIEAKFFEGTCRIQIEEGTEATSYKPYKEYTKTFYLNSPLLEGDTIEDINGVATHVKRYEKVVLDGSENWMNGVIEDVNYYYIILNKKGSKQFTTPSYCNTLVHKEGWSNSTHYFIDQFNKLVLINPSITTYSGFRQWLQSNPTTVVYQLASPQYETISTESILCDSYTNGHLDFDSAVPIEKIKFMPKFVSKLKYLLPNTTYKIQFKSDNIGYLDHVYMDDLTVRNIEVKKGINTIVGTTGNTINYLALDFHGIGFNASNIVVTETTDKEFDYFNGIQSTFEENLVTDENNPHYGKYRVIYRTKSSDGNASTVKSVYLNSPLLQGDKLVVVNGKLCHYHKMGKVVLDGSEDWHLNANGKYYGYNTSKVKAGDNKVMSDKLPTISEGWATSTLSISSHKSWSCIYINNVPGIITISDFKQWLQANPTTVVYELASPYYEEISSNPKDIVVDFYANGTLEVQSAVYPLSMEFTPFEEELTYLYASTVYTVQFEANGNATANITLGGATVTNQEITHGLNKIQVTTPSTLVDNKLIIDGCGDCKISKIVVTNSTEEFEYFEGMKSAFEDKQNEDGTYTVEIVVYNAPIRLNKDKE